MEPNLKKIISAFLCACIIASIGIVIYIVYNPPHSEKFTEFYMLGSSGKATGYPSNLMVGESGTVILGVINHEYEDMTYRIVARLNNISIVIMNDVILEHEEGWELNYTFTPHWMGEKMKLEFNLYKNGFDETYRTLHLWVTVRVSEV